jgi:excisionase family DNA binding protein
MQIASSKKSGRETPRQVAEHFSVTVPTVFNWLKQGIIPAKIAVGRVYRFDIEEVEEALVQHSKQTELEGAAK